MLKSIGKYTLSNLYLVDDFVLPHGAVRRRRFCGTPLLMPVFPKKRTHLLSGDVVNNQVKMII